MLHILNTIQLDSSVLNIDVQDEQIHIVDQKYSLYKYNKDCTRVNKVELYVDESELHKYSSAVSFSNNNMLFHPIPNSPLGEVFTIENGTPTNKAKISIHEANIEVSTFSEDSGLFATGAADGRSYIYDTSSMRYIIALPPRPDYISNLTFSKSNKFLLSSSFDLTNTLYNIQMAKIQLSFVSVDVLEAAIFIRDDRYIYYVLRNGASCIYSIHEGKLESEKNLFPSWPTAIVSMSEEPFIIVGTKSNKLHIVNSNTNSVEFSITLIYEGVNLLKIYGNILYIGFTNGSIQVVDLTAFKDKFILSTKLKNFANAKDCIDKNIFLKLNPLYSKSLSQNWENVVIKIMDTLVKDKYDKLELDEMVKPYLTNKECEKTYNSILRNKISVISLYNSIEDREFARAYAIVEKFPFLSVATPYKQLEKHWGNTLIKVKENIKKDPMRSEKVIENLLRSFFKVPAKKRVIDLLIKSPQILFDADSAVKEKRFDQYFAMCKLNPILQESSLYENVINLANNVVIQLDLGIENFDTAEVEKLSDFLEDFPMYQYAAKKGKIFLSDLKKYESCLDKKDYTKACEMTLINPALSQHAKYKTIEANFLATANKAQLYAISAKPKEALELLSKYWQIDHFKSKIANIAKLAYTNEIIKYKDVDTIDWNRTISAYLLRYGNDDYFRNSLRRMGLKSVLDECKDKIRTKNYKDFKLTKTLLIKKDV